MLDHTKGAEPLYSQVKKRIKANIIEGIYPVNAIMPTEKEWQEIFNVSRITVRKALEELMSEGYIARKRGKGTVVLRQSKIEEEIHVDRSFTEEMRARGVVPGTSHSQFRMVIAGGMIAKNLDLKDGAKVLELTRVRTADGIPIAIFQSYINQDVVQLTEDELADCESLYAILRGKGIAVTILKEVFEVSLSTEWNSLLLEIPLGTPLLKRATIVHTDGQPLLYTESTYNGYMYRYTTTHQKWDT